MFWKEPRSSWKQSFFDGRHLNKPLREGPVWFLSVLPLLDFIGILPSPLPRLGTYTALTLLLACAQRHLNCRHVCLDRGANATVDIMMNTLVQSFQLP